MPNEKKKEFGQVLNEFKQFAEAKFENAKESTTANNQLQLKKRWTCHFRAMLLQIGSRHPITLVRNRMVSIFQRLGFFCCRRA